MPQMDQMYAFVMTDPDDDEGIIGQRMSDGTWAPFVCSDMALIESIMPFAQEIADKAGKQVRIYRFSQKEQIGVIEPRSRA